MNDRMGESMERIGATVQRIAAAAKEANDLNERLTTALCKIAQHSFCKCSHQSRQECSDAIREIALAALEGRTA